MISKFRLPGDASVYDNAHRIVEKSYMSYNIWFDYKTLSSEKPYKIYDFNNQYYLLLSTHFIFFATL